MSSDTPLCTLALEPVIRLAGDDGRRTSEPVTAGVPFRRGTVRDVRTLALTDAQGAHVPLQASMLNAWPDGSVRWALLDFQATTTASGARYDVWVDDGAPARPVQPLAVEGSVGRVHVRAGNLELAFATGSSSTFSASWGGATTPVSLECRDRQGQPFEVTFSRVDVERDGPLRTVVKQAGAARRVSDGATLDVVARTECYAASPTVRLSITLRNPRRARHPGGFWDLGDPGSVQIGLARLQIALPHTETTRATVSCEPGLAFETTALPFELYQDSSGGINWKSPNHINRERRVPVSFRGYRARGGGSERSGERATPIVAVLTAAGPLAVAPAEFWQNFPKALDASATAVTVGLFPSQWQDGFELQGGEQKTQTTAIAFGPDAVTPEPLAWTRARLLVRLDPAYCSSTGVLPHLLPAGDDPHRGHRALIDQAIEGPTSFDAKRETLDEFGWRNFGDVYADHETLFHQADTPLVSHYNNQYDAIAGLGIQFLRTGDARWWRLMDEMARHVVDIDVYHTREDKAAYNGGLFWHTSHYTDADTSTHRSYPAAHPATGGGGPSPQHLYGAGLALHYYLTGTADSRDTSIGFGQFVIDCDDGRLSPFRWLARGATGLASASGGLDYHGPGRGAANSLGVLLQAYELTNDRRFVDKADELIRRCIHPEDDLVRRELHDIERRWYYAMFLQALGRYLDLKQQRAELDDMYAYGRASLLHYARWMVEHERPTLDRATELEFPTETWAAQDMRKAEALWYAAMHASVDERQRLARRARFFFDYSVTTLLDKPTRGFTRPVALMMTNGAMAGWIDVHGLPTAAEATREVNFGQPSAFEAQRVVGLRRGALLAGAAAVLGVMVCALLLLAWSIRAG